MTRRLFNLLLVALAFNSLTTSAKERITNTRLKQLSGEKPYVISRRNAWNNRYNKNTYIYGKSPAKFLAENYDYIPKESKVLDMGMGEGRNAVFLAQKGHDVLGVDISGVAIKKARDLAKEFGVKIKAVEASLDTYVLEKESLDAIICFYYLDRDLLSKMMEWLKPGGIIMFEAHHRMERNKKDHRKNPLEYYLADNELLSMFKGMEILKYEAPKHEEEFRQSIIVKKE